MNNNIQVSSFCSCNRSNNSAFHRKCSYYRISFLRTKSRRKIGTPVDALIGSDAGIGGFLQSALTNLYGRCFQLHLSVSPLSLQSPNIIYQVDNIIGVTNVPPPPRTLLTNCMYIEHLCLLFSQCFFYSYNY